jgi:hypothetical protein
MMHSHSSDCAHSRDASINPAQRAAAKRSAHKSWNMYRSQVYDAWVISSDVTNHRKPGLLHGLQKKLSTLHIFNSKRPDAMLPSSSRTTTRTSMSFRSGHIQHAGLREEDGSQRRSVKFWGSSSMSLKNLSSEYTGSGIVSPGVMVDGLALDSATQEMLKAMQTCMRRSITDRHVLECPQCIDLMPEDYAYVQKVRHIPSGLEISIYAIRMYMYTNVLHTYTHTHTCTHTRKRTHTCTHTHVHTCTHTTNNIVAYVQKVRNLP